jgi:hypothetical protein
MGRDKRAVCFCRNPAALPGESLLVVAAILAGRGRISFPLFLLLSAWTGPVIGGNIGSMIGRWLGHRALCVRTEHTERPPQGGLSEIRSGVLNEARQLWLFQPLHVGFASQNHLAHDAMTLTRSYWRGCFRKTHGTTQFTFSVYFL